MSEIAIASVTPQDWEKPYEISGALSVGSIFPALHKPFYIEEQMKKPEVTPLSDCEAKLLEIQQVSFFLTDLTLFLDTHPGHEQAKAMKAEVQQKRKQLVKEFAEKYYPLTMDCKDDCCDSCCSDMENAPWEGGRQHVAL